MIVSFGVNLYCFFSTPQHRLGMNRDSMRWHCLIVRSKEKGKPGEHESVPFSLFLSPSLSLPLSRSLSLSLSFPLFFSLLAYIEFKSGETYDDLPNDRRELPPLFAAAAFWLINESSYGKKSFATRVIEKFVKLLFRIIESGALIFNIQGGFS